MNPHQPAPTTFSSLVGSLWRNRGLILQLIQRDVVGRYNGSIFGLAWSFLDYHIRHKNCQPSLIASIRLSRLN